MSHLRLRLCVVIGALLALTGTANAFAANVVISEFRVRGPVGGNDEFIELYNTTSAPIDISGWKVKGSNSSGVNSARATIPAGRILGAGCHYLLTNSTTSTGYSGSVAGDQTFATGVTDDGGIALTLVDDTIVDQVGMSAGSAFGEGTRLTSLGTTNGDRGYERRPGGAAGNAQDTGDNAADFSVTSPTNPQNQLSSCIPPAASTNPSGTGAATPSSVDAGAATLLTVAVTPGTNPASSGLTVSGDLSSIGGSAAQAFVDDATNGDATAGDNVFSYSATVAAATAPGGKSLPVSIADAQSRSGSTAIALTVTPAAEPPGLGTPLVINEFRVRGPGGGNDEFVELYNASSSTIPIGGLKVSGSNVSGTVSVRATIPAGKVLGAGCYYLFTNSGAYSGTVPGDQTYGTGVTDDGGLALQSADNTILDQVGLSSGSAYKEGTPLASLGSSNLDRGYARKAGGRDTNDNATDFVLATPSTPQSTATCGVNPDVDDAPTVSATTPAAGASDVALAANVAITFSEPVNVTDGWYSISCATSGAHTASATGGPVTFTLDPATNFAGGELCTVTVFAANVSDQDTNDPPDAPAGNHVFTFRTLDAFNCGDPATLIHDIQGSGPAAAMTGSQTIEGVVTFDSQATGQFNGYFVQEEVADQDGNAATSEGIFVFSGSGVDNVSTGDVVRVRGTAGEFSGMTQLSTITALAKCGTGSVPATPVMLPVANVGDHESFEGMLVRYTQTLTANEVFNLGRFGEVSLSGAGRLYNSTAVAAPGAPAQAVAAQNARSRIILDDASNTQNNDPTLYPQGGLSATNTLRVGDTLNGLTGVLEFRFSNYRIQPVGSVEFQHTNLRTAAPAAVGGNLKLASFNVLNYFNDFGCGDRCRGAENQFEFDRQEAKIVSALAAIDGDIVGLMEIENDGGAGNALAELVAALNAATAPGTYAYIDTGVIGTDAIKVALIYQPAAVAPVGAWDILTTADDPRFIDTRNRPALAQTFRHLGSGQVITVAVNHLKSKGSDCGGAPDDQPDTGGGNCNGTRTAAAAALADWLQSDPTGSGDPDFMIIGDLNAYTFETPITTLEADGFTNLVRRFHGLDAYSYVFNGESGYLDHALATASLVPQVTGISDWHINPDEPTVLDYNTNFKSANHVNTLYAPGPYRASDHDPIIIGLQLNSAPTADAGGPYTVAEGGSVTVTASGSDADGDTLAYAWDLDNDGEFDDATGPSASFSAADIDGPATRTIRVRVTDASSNAIDTATVNVTNVAPTATFNAPASALAGSAFTLSLTNATDAAPADRPGLQYAFDCGSGYGAFSAVNTAACPTSSTGTRNVGGKVRDDDGGVTEYRATVTVKVTFASLCALVQEYVDKEGVANALCSKLEAAERKADRKGQEADLHAFVNQVEAQSGKSMTAAEAATLIRLAGDL